MNQTLRQIDDIITIPSKHWVGDGFFVSGVFSNIRNAARRLDPFLLMDYHPPHDYPPTDQARGVGVHPHRGFETVTLAWQGSVAHHDNAGGEGVIGPGDVQWMTAASGVLHKEYHEAAFSKAGGLFHMMQLWVNLPAKHKMDDPRYQSITHEEIPHIQLDDSGGHVRVIAGDYDDVKGPALTFSPVVMLDMHLNPENEVVYNAPEHYNVMLLVMEGSLDIEDAGVDVGELVIFANDNTTVKLRATSKTHCMLLAGEPIGEPIVQQGPFVMNTRQEIMTAIRDFNSGKFGTM